MEMKVFVGQLDYALSEDELRDEFSDCGEITDLKIIKDYETGRSKGFGFISPSEGDKDLFVHMSEIKMDGFKTLKEGATVDYEEGSSDKGPCATNVVPK